MEEEDGNKGVFKEVKKKIVKRMKEKKRKNTNEKFDQRK